MFQLIKRLNWLTKMRCCCYHRNLSVVSLSSLVPFQLPSPMETHFWYVVPDEIKSVSLLNRYMEFLSPCERENVLSMRGDQLQKRALLARTLVRTTIARYQINGHVDPKSIKFRKNAHGKPELERQIDDGRSSPLLHFNLSHTSSLIACGVTVNSQLGIDVEEKQRKLKNDILTFAKRYFSPVEVDYLTAISDSEIQRQEFVKLWTLKEAYVKALGRGFSAVPFKTFTIHIKPATRGGFDHARNLHHEQLEIIVESSDLPKNLTSCWRFALFELAGSHYASICMEKDNVGETELNIPMKLTTIKTIPLVEHGFISGTDAVVPIGGLFKQSNCVM